MRILVIDDEEHIAELLRFNFALKGYDVEIAYDGVEALIKARECMPDLILLDRMLPNIDGIEVLKLIRSDSDLKKIPVIMLTAKNMEIDKIEGLEFGADDYITKPFSIREVLARVIAVTRRYYKDQIIENKVITLRELKIDLQNFMAYKNDKKIDLTLKEYELLKLLIINKDNVLSRNTLLNEVWGYAYFGETRTVDVHIRHLRKKLEDDDKNPRYIETIRGIGYKIKGSDDNNI